MTHPGSSPPGAAGGRRPIRRRLRRIFLSVGLVLFVAVGVLFMLPIWASSTQGRQYALEQINRKLNGTLKVRSWSLGWFSGIRMEGVELATAEGTRVLECDQLESELTLWEWYWGHYDLGNTRLLRPRVTLACYPDGTNDLQRVLGRTPASGAAANGVSWLRLWNSLRGSVRVEDGQVVLVAPGPAEPIRLSNITAQIPIASPTTPIHLTLTGKSSTAAGSAALELRGDLPPVNQWAEDPAAIGRDVTIRAGALPVGTLAAWFGLDPAWEEGLGQSLDELVLESQGIDEDQATSSLRIRSADATVDLRLLVRDHKGEVTLALPPGDYRAQAKMRAGAPVLALLGYVNPMLAAATPGKGSVECALTNGELNLTRPLSMKADGVVTLRGIELRSSGLLRDIAGLTRHEGPAAGAAAALPAIMPAMRIVVESGSVTAAPVVITMPEQPRMTFTGQVNLDRSVHLLLTLPFYQAGGPGLLTAATMQVPIHGTIDHPTLDTQAVLGGK